MSHFDKTRQTWPFWSHKAAQSSGCQATRAVFFGVLVWLASCLTGCQQKLSFPSPIKSLQATPACDAPFAGRQEADKERWRGGDNGQSERLPNGKVVWVFSDSWVGQRKGEGRHNARLIRNSLALQAQASCQSSVSFFWRTDAEKKSIAFFQPAGGEGFFWPLSIKVVHNALLIFAQHLKVNPRPANIFDGAIHLANTLLVVSNPLDEPPQWRISQHTFAKAGKPIVNYGLKLFLDKSAPRHLFLLGSEEKGGGKTHISLHRFLWDATQQRIETPQTLQPDGTWSQELVAPRKQLFVGASQTSVHFDATRKLYIALYARGWEGIWWRSSQHLTQGWSSPHLLYRYPELSRNKNIFCGTLGVHLALTQDPDKLALTYMCNSTDFWAMAGDLSIYVPKFLQLQLENPAP